MLSVASGAHDPFRSESDRPVDYRIGLEDGVAGLRVAYCPGIAGVTVDPIVAASVAQAADVLAALCARRASRCEAAGQLSGQSYARDSVVGVLCATCMRDERDATCAARLGRTGPCAVRSASHRARTCRCTACTSSAGCRDGRVLRALRLARDTGVSLRPIAGARVAEDIAHGTSADIVVQPDRAACRQHTVRPARWFAHGVQIVGRLHADALVLRAARAYESARGAFPTAPLLQGEHAVATEVTP